MSSMAMNNITPPAMRAGTELALPIETLNTWQSNEDHHDRLLTLLDISI